MSDDDTAVTTPDGDIDSPTEAAPSPAVEIAALAQLWADQFRHLTTLGVAGAGGVLIMIQADLIEPQGRWWLSLVLFVMSAVSSMYGQIAVVDEVSEGAAPGKRPRVIRSIALATLGAAGGAALATLTRP
jgi:hypothetical protein